MQKLQEFFDLTTCDAHNGSLPNLTQVINSIKFDPSKNLWNIYFENCINSDMHRSNKDINFIAFSENYSLFLQNLLISLLESLDKEPIEPELSKISEKLLTTPPEDFFLLAVIRRILY